MVNGLYVKLTNFNNICLTAKCLNFQYLALFLRCFTYAHACHVYREEDDDAKLAVMHVSIKYGIVCT